MTNGEMQPTAEEVERASRFADHCVRLAIGGRHGDVDICRAALADIQDEWGGDGMTYAALAMARSFHAATGMDRVAAAAADPDNSESYFSFDYHVVEVHKDADGNRIDLDGNVVDDATADEQLMDRATQQFRADRQSLNAPGAANAPDDLAALADAGPPQPVTDPTEGTDDDTAYAVRSSVLAMQFCVAIANGDGEQGSAILETAAPTYGFQFLFSLAQITGQAWARREAETPIPSAEAAEHRWRAWSGRADAGADRDE